MRFALYLIVLFSVSLADSLPLVSFLTQEAAAHRARLEQHFGAPLKAHLNEVGVDATLCDTLLLPLFLHKLLTTSDAIDGVRSGILQVPYFWHWCTPNPRHALLYRPTGAPLQSVKPPAGFSKYKSYADVDRTPRLYLANLFADSALFESPEHGQFYSFGWCSEREMSYALLMRLLGYECKVYQEGIHVWSELLIQRGTARVIVRVDNTFESFSVAPLAVSAAAWRKDLGKGAQVGWYNRKVQGQAEQAVVKALVVGESRQRQIRELVESFYEGL